MEVIPPNLADYQKRILLSDARFTITEASTKSGKTYSHIIWLFSKAHEKDVEHNGKNYWWVAPVSYQSEIAYSRFKKYLRETGLYKFNDTKQIIHCPNGARIWFKSAEKPDNLYGEDVYAAVFDEAPRARETAWYALRTTLTSTEAPCKLIGNFGGKANWVHRLKEKTKDDPIYEYFRITCWDAVREGILSKEEVLQAKSDLPEKIFKLLYEVEEVEERDRLISNESIGKLFSNTHLDDENEQMSISVDVARMGQDLTIIRVWRGLASIKTVSMKTSKVNEVVEAVKREMIEYNINDNRIVIDEDGVGGGVVDYLPGCYGFVNGSVPIKVAGDKQNFAHLKAQCQWKLAKMINANKIYIKANEDEREKVIEELEVYKLPKEIDTNKIALINKDIMKRELGRSPDYSDSLMMRMVFELDPTYGYYSIY